MFALKQRNKVELEGRKLRVFKSREIPSTEVRKKAEKRQPKFQGLQSAKPGRKDFKTQRRTRTEVTESKAWKPRGGRGGLAKLKQKSHEGTHPKRKPTPKDNKR